MSLITKQLIWAEIETIEAVEKMAYAHSLFDYASGFMVDLRNYKARLEKDLIEETQKA